MSTTADGKRLVFTKWVPHKAISIADLDANGRQISKPSRFAPSAAFDFLGDWTADSKAVVFTSDRNGHYGIFKQSVGNDSVQTLVSRPEDVLDPVVSPDGASVLYVVSPEKRDASQTVRVMRVPVEGGVAQQVLEAGPEFSENFGMIRCAKSPSPLCVMAERSGEDPTAILIAFDPLKGRGRELARFDLSLPESSWLWDLSPDGTRIAFCKSREGPIEVLCLGSNTTEEIRVKGWGRLGSLDWAADGKGFFVGSSVPKGDVLLHVDLQGDAQVLWQKQGPGGTFGRPSRDGRRLAIEVGTVDGNIWMMEDF